jgi:putative transposase
MVTAEDGAAWLAYVRGLVAGDLTGVRVARSDAHPGLVDAIAATLTVAAWQRCRTHVMHDLLTRGRVSGESVTCQRSERGCAPV